MSTTEPWVSVIDVAKHLGVRKDSVYRWIEQRELPAKKIGKLWKLKLSEVEAWVRRGGADVPEAPEPGTLAISESKPTSRPAARPLILVIDDEAMVRDTVAEFLDDEGFNVLAAADGAEALALLGRSAIRPALILLDLAMPNVDGWGFRELQTRDPALASIPVIVVTAAAGDADMPGVTVLGKPLRLPELSQAIAQVLDQRTELAEVEPR